jgi:hypothetical protein
MRTSITGVFIRSPSRAGAPAAAAWLAQQVQRIDRGFGCEQVDPLQRIERLQHAQQRFDSRSPAGFEIAQGLFRNARLLGGRELIEVAVQTQAPQPLTEEDLEFVRGGEDRVLIDELNGTYTAVNGLWQE